MRGVQRPGTRGLLAARIVFIATFLLAAPLLAGVWNWIGSGYLSIDGWQMGAVPNLLVGCLALAFEEWLWRKRWWWPVNGTLFLLRSVALHLVYVALAFRLSITMGHVYGAYLVHGWAANHLARAFVHSLPSVWAFLFTLLLTGPAGVVVGFINGCVLWSRGARARGHPARPTSVPPAAPSTRRSAPGRFPRLVLWAMGGGGGAVALWAVASAGLVVWRAEALAQGRPYCIQVASPNDGSSYEAATRLWDLTAWRMRARCCGGEGSNSFIFHHHAILVVSDSVKFYNWSYRKQNFVDEVMERKYRNPPIACIPEPHFGRRLPYVFRDPARKHTLRLGNRTYALPQEYRPRLQTDFVGNPRLVLTAVAPAFDPFHGGRLRWSSLLYYDVVLRPEPSHAVETVWTQWAHQRTVEDAGEESGLTKAVVFLVDKTAPSGKRPAAFLYYAKTDDGRLSTLIRCDALFTPDRCWHHFARDGVVVSFYHARDRLADWAAMQATLAGLIASFVTETVMPQHPSGPPARAAEAGAPATAAPASRASAPDAVPADVPTAPAVPASPSPVVASSEARPGRPPDALRRSTDVASVTVEGEVHAVGVYEGALPDGRQRQFRERPLGVVAVPVTVPDRPVRLVLTAYEPVLWQVTVAPGSRLTQVITRGYHTPQLQGVPDGVPVSIESYDKDRRYFYLAGPRSDQVQAFAAHVQAATGRALQTVQYAYRPTEIPVDGVRSLPLPAAAPAGSAAPTAPGRAASAPAPHEEWARVLGFVRTHPAVVRVAGGVTRVYPQQSLRRQDAVRPDRYIASGIGDRMVSTAVDVTRSAEGSTVRLACVSRRPPGQRDRFKDVCAE